LIRFRYLQIRPQAVTSRLAVQFSFANDEIARLRHGAEEGLRGDGDLAWLCQQILDRLDPTKAAQRARRAAALRNWDSSFLSDEGTQYPGCRHL
jgi:hypothetical protein